MFAGASYWLNHGEDPTATIVTIWSSGPGHWALRSTVGYAAKLTVRDPDHRAPHFTRWKPYLFTPDDTRGAQ